MESERADGTARMPDEIPRRRSRSSAQFSLRRLFRLVTFIVVGVAICALGNWDPPWCIFFAILLVLAYDRRWFGGFGVAVAVALAIVVFFSWYLQPSIR